MSAPDPWKLAVTGGLGIAAGAALLSVDWTPSQLAAFAGLAMLARGALHVVTLTPFVGFAGAFAALAVAGDAGVGITALAWPDPTLASLTLLLIGAWALVRAIAGGTIAVATRADNRWWLLFFAFAIVAAALGVIPRSSGSTRGAAVIIGLWALLEGAREVSEAGFRHRRERRHQRAAHATSSAAAS